MNDAFISYAHNDNRPLNGVRWINSFHENLETCLNQKCGNRVIIWRDKKMRGNDHIDNTILIELRKSYILISVLSPSYVNSRWCRKELSEFWNFATNDGGVYIGCKSRIFKVIQCPIPPEDEPREMENLIGYQFFGGDDEDSVYPEIDSGGKKQKYFDELRKLAKDICSLLREIKTPKRSYKKNQNKNDDKDYTYRRISPSQEVTRRKQYQEMGNHLSSIKLTKPEPTVEQLKGALELVEGITPSTSQSPLINPPTHNINPIVPTLVETPELVDNSGPAGQEVIPLRRLTIVGKIAAGTETSISNHDIIGYIDQIAESEFQFEGQPLNITWLTRTRVTCSEEYDYLVLQIRDDGDSMNQAGISPGDWVILRRPNRVELKPQHRDIVAVVFYDEINNRATLKRILIHRDIAGEPQRVSFVPESSNPIHPPRTFSPGAFLPGNPQVAICGIAIAVLRPQ